jgi:hypothetical protein
LSEATSAYSLGGGAGAGDEDELYPALDLLGEAQPKIEIALAEPMAAIAALFFRSHILTAKSLLPPMRLKC